MDQLRGSFRHLSPSHNHVHSVPVLHITFTPPLSSSVMLSFCRTGFDTRPRRCRNSRQTSTEKKISTEPPCISLSRQPREPKKNRLSRRFSRTIIAADHARNSRNKSVMFSFERQLYKHLWKSLFTRLKSGNKKLNYNLTTKMCVVCTTCEQYKSTV